MKKIKFLSVFMVLCLLIPIVGCKKVSKKADVSNSSLLTEDWSSFKIEIDSDVYTFPMSYEEFTSFGLTYDEDENIMLDSMERIHTKWFRNEKIVALTSITNLENDVLSIKDCYINEIRIDSQMISYFVENPDDIQIILPCGIMLGTSTSDDVRAAYGMPSDVMMIDAREYLTYQLNYESYIRLSFEEDTQILEGITIRNSTISIESPPIEEKGEFSEIDNKYAPPDAMSTQFADWIIDFAGDMYHLPAPVSAFTENGWVIDQAESDLEIKGRDSGLLLIRKNNQYIRTTVQNYTEDAMSISNCFVTTIRVYSTDSNLPLIFPRGITVGMQKDDVQELLKDIEYVDEEVLTTRIYYIYPIGEKNPGHYAIMIDDETDLVVSMEVSYCPSYDDFTNQ